MLFSPVEHPHPTLGHPSHGTEYPKATPAGRGEAGQPPGKGLLLGILGDLAVLARQAGFVLTCSACLYAPE